MATGVTSWSQTAASNGTADSTVNMAEGMAPSAVNDGVRAAMASVAKYRDDLNGSITTGGTSTAYTVTSNQGMALTAGYSVCFCPHATNGATVTVNVDGIGGKPLRPSPGAELPAGVLVQGTPYVATYYASNSGEWILRDFYGNPYNIPLGGMLPYAGSTAPNSSFVLPFGQAISRTTYASLFSLVSTAFGTGDGSTTFNVPDLRGRSIFGLDNMGGSAASRIGSVVTDSGTIVGTTLGSVGGSSTHILAATELPSHTHTGTTGSESATHAHTFSGTTSGQSADHTHLQNGAGISAGGTIGSGNQFDVHTSSTGVASNDHTHTYSGTTAAENALHTHSYTTDGGSGGGAAHAQLPPAMMLPYILRVI